MEWDDERSGGFEPLRYVPKGKTVVLGLVTTKRAELERKDDAQAPHRGGVAVRRRSTSSACRRSAASPRPREGNNLTADEQLAKLELVVETAAEVWGE